MFLCGVQVKRLLLLQLRSVVIVRASTASVDGLGIFRALSGLLVGAQRFAALFVRMSYSCPCPTTLLIVAEH